MRSSQINDLFPINVHLDREARDILNNLGFKNLNLIVDGKTTLNFPSSVKYFCNSSDIINGVREDIYYQVYTNLEGKEEFDLNTPSFKLKEDPKKGKFIEIYAEEKRVVISQNSLPIYKRSEVRDDLLSNKKDAVIFRGNFEKTEKGKIDLLKRIGLEVPDPDSDDNTTIRLPSKLKFRRSCMILKTDEGEEIRIKYFKQDQINKEPIYTQISKSKKDFLVINHENLRITLSQSHPPLPSFEDLWNNPPEIHPISELDEVRLKLLTEAVLGRESISASNVSTVSFKEQKKEPESTSKGAEGGRDFSASVLTNYLPNLQEPSSSKRKADGEGPRAYYDSINKRLARASLASSQFRYWQPVSDTRTTEADKKEKEQKKTKNRCLTS